MDAFHLLEAERHAEFHIACGVGVMGQFLMVVEAVVFCAEAQSLVPCHTGILPGFKPFQFGAGLHEELHFHLLELAHTEDKLAGNDFVAESLAYLCNAEGDFHTARFLHVEIVHENALSRFGTQIDGRGAVGRGSDFRFEHEVKLAHIRPVPRTADGTGYFLVKNNLF